MYILHCKRVCDGSFLKYIWLFFEKNTKQKLNHPCLVKEYWISNIEGLYQLVLSYVTLSLHHTVLSSLLLPLRVLIECHVGCKSHYNFNLLVPSTSTGLISSSVQPWQLPEHSIQGSNAHGSVVLLSAAGTLLETIHLWGGGTAEKSAAWWFCLCLELKVLLLNGNFRKVECCGIIEFHSSGLLNLGFAWTSWPVPMARLEVWMSVLCICT